MSHPPQTPPPPTVLITGASGFIGQILATELLAQLPDHHLILTDTSEPPVPRSTQSAQSTRIAADLTTSIPGSLLPDSLVAVYALHGLMSFGSEANLDLGLRVNIDSHRKLLDAVRAKSLGRDGPAAKLKYIFPSSTAIFAKNPPGEVYDELTLPVPGGSYGAQKLIVEVLVHDYSRRGIVDGRIARLPTVVVRPGQPSAAASSFASGIVRESVRGVANACPVREATRLWVCSPGVVARNLVRLLAVDAGLFGRAGRRVNLPGQCVSVRQMLDALEAVCGPEVRGLVRMERDEGVEALVENWPTEFDTALALGMGLEADVALEEIVRGYVESVKGR